MKYLKTPSFKSEVIFSDEELRDSLALGGAQREVVAYPQSEMLEFNSSSEMIAQSSATITGEWLYSNLPSLPIFWVDFNSFPLTL